jgi:hypothetical protein
MVRAADPDHIVSHSILFCRPCDFLLAYSCASWLCLLTRRAATFKLLELALGALQLVAWRLRSRISASRHIT